MGNSVVKFRPIASTINWRSRFGLSVLNAMTKVMASLHFMRWRWNLEGWTTMVNNIVFPLDYCRSAYRCFFLDILSAFNDIDQNPIIAYLLDWGGNRASVRHWADSFTNKTRFCEVHSIFYSFNKQGILEGGTSIFFIRLETWNSMQTVYCWITLIILVNGNILHLPSTFLRHTIWRFSQTFFV